MIIDSHAHYAHPRFRANIPYFGAKDETFAVDHADKETLISSMRQQGIMGFIEPSIGFDQIENQAAFVSAHRDFAWMALGVHPTRCIHVPWEKREKVKEYAESYPIIAIGETGLDYHYKRKKQHRFRQKRWFIYQLKLADQLNLPLVLHIRKADRDGLRILKRYKNMLHGGVAHCFVGDHKLAEKYIALGLALGVGGRLLDDTAEGRALQDTVANVPLTSLLVETDAPYVLPKISEQIVSDKDRKKLCNTSLILPAVIRRIAELRGEPYDAVEAQIYRNTLRIFKLDQQEENSNESIAEE